jgi:hypothetical protein
MKYKRMKSGAIIVTAILWLCIDRLKWQPKGVGRNTYPWRVFLADCDLSHTRRASVSIDFLP